MTDFHAFVHLAPDAIWTVKFCSLVESSSIVDLFEPRLQTISELAPAQRVFWDPAKVKVRAAVPRPDSDDSDAALEDIDDLVDAESDAEGDADPAPADPLDELNIEDRYIKLVGILLCNYRFCPPPC
jgi:hypothetical protein